MLSFLLGVLQQTDYRLTESSFSVFCISDSTKRIAHEKEPDGLVAVYTTSFLVKIPATSRFPEHIFAKCLMQYAFKPPTL